MALELSLDVCAYKGVEGDQSYLESYVRVLAPTVSFVDIDGGMMQAAVNITVTIEQGDQIVAYDKFVLNSPKVSSETDFIDIRRFGLSPATYAVHVIAVDVADMTNKIELKQYIEVPSYDETAVSDIMLLSKVVASDEAGPMVKHGMHMEPITFSYVAEQTANLPFFVELYDLPSGVYLKYSVSEGYVDGGPELIVKYKKLEQTPVLPLVLALPVDKLRSGKYTLTLDIYNSDKELLATNKVNFLRNNPSYDKQYWSDYNESVDGSFVDSIADADLRYHLLGLLPVMQEPALTNLTIVLDMENVNAQRKFIFDYWKDKSPKYPHIAMAKYMKVVDLVHELYDNNVGFGFQTDRGHIFLKYGKPSEVVSVDNEPDAVPYEIWYYHTLSGVTRQTNTRFLFYNPSLAHNDYQLLHSTCIGERNNPAWEVELYRDAPESQIGSTIEATQVERGWNRRAREYFDDY